MSSTEEQKRENFYRHSRVIVDETKFAFIQLLVFYLGSSATTYKTFIENNVHEIYHLCVNQYPCCQCPNGTRRLTKGQRVLHHQQLSKLLDTSGTKLHGHIPGSLSAVHNCCSPVNPTVTLNDLDVTLARVLLVNFTNIVPVGSVERHAIESLIKTRNNSMAHATESKMEDTEYKASFDASEKSLLVLAKVYGKETETRQRIQDIKREPLNLNVCIDLTNNLLKQLDIDNTLKKMGEAVYDLEKIVKDKLIPEHIIKDIENVKVLEGCDACFEIWLKGDIIPVQWFKNHTELVSSSNVAIEQKNNIHSLTITKVDLEDKGEYSVKVKDTYRTALLNVEAYYTKNIKDIHCIEGDDVSLNCEVIESDMEAQWYKDGVEYENTNQGFTKNYGKCHMLRIPDVKLSDRGRYTVDINNRQRAVQITVKAYFTKDLEDVRCIEGESCAFVCEVIEDNTTANWLFENNEVQASPELKLETVERQHKLMFANTQVSNSGEYYVIVNNRKRTAFLHVKTYFTKDLEDATCIEGGSCAFVCEVMDDNTTANWFFDNKHVKSSPEIKLQTLDRHHQLIFTNAQVLNSGEYSVIVNNRKRTAFLHVENIPLHLNEKDKQLYMDIMKSKTELRHYIRILILGKHGVGKTSLLRRLLGEGIEGVTSTDGIDIIVKRCRIRLSDGKWFVEEEWTWCPLSSTKIPYKIHYYYHWLAKRLSYITVVQQLITDRKKELLARIKSAVNENATPENLSYNPEESENVSDNTAESANVSDNTAESANVSDNHIQGDDLRTVEQNIQRRKASSRKPPSSIVNTYVEKARNQSTDTKYVEKNRTDIKNNYKQHQTNAPISYESNEMSSADSEKQERISNAISGKVKEALDTILNGIESVELPMDQFIECGFWDFAGEKDYYATHEIFLHSHALYVLVEDINEDIKQVKTGCSFNSIGGYIDFWFDNIHSHRIPSPNEDKLDPPVIVVCTGTDKCKDKLNYQRDTFRRHLLSVLGNEEKKHLRQLCFASNTEPKDKEFDELRSAIFEHGKSLHTFSERLPLRWIQLERTLDVLRDAGVNILSKDNMTELSLKYGIGNENEILLFLRYQHAIGSLIFFEAIPQYIILTHTWLANAFRCLVSDKFHSNVKLTTQWKKLEDTGELEYSLIEKLFEKEPTLEFNKYQGHILSIMEQFDTIVKPTTHMVGDNRHTTLSYYMPCMIHSHTSLDDIFEVFGATTNSCSKTPWLCIEFKHMPLSFFNHILFHYIRKYNICLKPSNGQPAMYHSLAVFFVDEIKFTKLLVCFFKNTLAIQIWHWSELASGICKSILLDLQELIENLKVKYETKKIDYQVKTKCGEGDIQTPAGRMSYNNLAAIKSDVYFCEEHTKPHQSSQMYETWFEDFSENGYEDTDKASRLPSRRQKPTHPSISTHPPVGDFEQLDEEQYALVVAIDFGTTYSGYAYCKYSDYKNNKADPLIHCSQWIGEWSVTSKAPTCVLFDQNQEFVKFGYDAMDYYQYNHEEIYSNDWYYFNNFKMILYEEKDRLTKNTVLEASIDTQRSDKAKMKAIDVFAAVIKYFKEQFLDERRKLGGCNDEKIRWVLTVPAIWDLKARIFMREAAVKAGIPTRQLLLALEPEAASIHCRRVPDGIKSESGKQAIAYLNIGSKYIVIDLGGGTIDIAVHEVTGENTLKEIYQACGGHWGGNKVNTEFLNFLDHIFGDDIVQEVKKTCSSAHNELLCNFEKAKTKFSQADVRDRRGFIIIVLPYLWIQVLCKIKKVGVSEWIRETNDYHRDVILRNNKLRLRNSLFVSFFEYSIANIKTVLEMLIFEKGFSDVRTLLVVGGHSESTVLTMAINDQFPKLRIVVPKQPSLAIMKGAVIFGFEPGIITSRVMQYTYGISIQRPFITGVDAESMKSCLVNGLVDNVFDKHIEHGQTVKVGEFQSERKYVPVHKDQHSVHFKFYATLNKSPKYVTDEGCNYIGVLYFELSGGTSSNNELRLKINGSGVEIEAIVTESATGKQSEGYFCLLD